jgi:pimeloyl-ACP methyl ester carboxylesterase
MDAVGRRRISGQIAAYCLVLMGGVFMFASLQRQMIYYPQVEPEEDLLRAASRMGLLDWRDGSGQLIGWRSNTAEEKARRVVVFHGNAGYALHRDYYVAGFLAQGRDWEVYLFEYPGYGARPGEPSESGIKAAATEALALLLGSDARPVYLVGESLGSGVASYLSSQFPEQVGGMLLVTPFTSLPDVAAHHYGFLPVRRMLSERFDSRAALSHYRGPVAFLLAGSDEIVPTELGRQLYESYAGPKWLRVQPGAGHNTLSLYPGADWWREVTAFLTADRE